ncbi:MAG: sigma-70 family RNA polymerase sigma factor [Phycisphaerae bacterium]|nr:sigma-70 family RNA polymerase sigma factor [Phycisphaerae bacterium]
MSAGSSEQGDEAPSTGTIVLEDAALIERVRTGDMQAFGALVTKYQDRVFNMLCRMCSRSADAEELTQETFLKALEKIGQFRGASRFYTWLFRIAANLAISHRRRGRRIRFQSLDGPAESNCHQAAVLTAAIAGCRQPPPDAAAMSADATRRLEEAIEQLDGEYRLVILLREMEEMDYAEIAQVLAVPVGTVKSRLHRARSMLREKLADLI